MQSRILIGNLIEFENIHAFNLWNIITIIKGSTIQAVKGQTSMFQDWQMPMVIDSRSETREYHSAAEGQ